MATDREALLLQVSADVSRLQKQFDKATGIVDAGSKKMERRVQQASTNLERFFGKTDPAKALDKVFDATRFRVLDSGVAKIGLMGSALESLGPIGLGAAAAIGAVAAAFAGAREAARFADDINDTAARLHVTTDALQEYRYAIRAAGGEEQGADEALEGFSVTLGKAQQGLAKSQRAFLALGFSKAQIKGFADADTALKAVTERIAGLSTQQQDAIIQQLGLDGLKPLIEGGLASMQRLREEAHKVGIVMDADLVKRGGELNDQFETVTKVIDLQLKSALVDLGPILLNLLGFMADLAKAAADVADAFRSIENKRTDHLKDLRADFAQRAASPVGVLTRDHDLKRVAEIDAELAKRAQRDKAPAPPKPSRSLIDTTKHGAGPRDDTEQRTESVNSALASAGRDLLQAQGRLTDDVEARATIERQIAAEELKIDLARLAKQAADIDDDKGISAATKVTLKAKLDEAATASKKASEAKIDLINRQAAWDAEDIADETRKQVRDAEIAQLEIASGLAVTQEQRRAIELQILKIKQDELTHELGKALSRDVQSGKIDQATADQRFEAGRSGFAGQRAQVRAGTRGPIEDFVAANAGAAKFKQTLEEIGVSGFQNLSDSLAQAVVNADDLGDVAKNVFRQIIAQILSASISNVGATVGASLLHLIPGFAQGTSFAPGGVAMVGERGPELVKLPRGSQVVPTSKTLAALQNLKVGKTADVTVLQPFHFHAEGAVLTQEILDQANKQSQRNAAAAAQWARRQTRGDMASAEYARNLNA